MLLLIRLDRMEPCSLSLIIFQLNHLVDSIRFLSLLVVQSVEVNLRYIHALPCLVLLSLLGLPALLSPSSWPSPTVICWLAYYSGDPIFISRHPVIGFWRHWLRLLLGFRSWIVSFGWFIWAICWVSTAIISFVLASRLISSWIILLILVLPVKFFGVIIIVIFSFSIFPIPSFGSVMLGCSWSSPFWNLLICWIRLFFSGFQVSSLTPLSSYLLVLPSTFHVTLVVTFLKGVQSPSFMLDSTLLVWL